MRIANLRSLDSSYLVNMVGIPSQSLLLFAKWYHHSDNALDKVYLLCSNDLKGIVSRNRSNEQHLSHNKTQQHILLE